MTEAQTMPANVSAEKAVLGAVLLDNKAIYEAATLSAGDFHIDAHQRIFRHMLELDDAGKAIDTVTLTEALSKVKAVEAIGGLAYLSTLTDGLPRRPSIANYVDIVRDKSERRQLIRRIGPVVTELQGQTESTRACKSAIEDALLQVEAGSRLSEVKHVGQIGTRVLDNILRIAMHGGGPIGLTTGIELLDDETTGYRKGEIVFIGGRPKQGKSSLMIQSAIPNLKAGIAVGMFSLELSEDDILNRMYSIVSGVWYYKIRDPRKLTQTDKDLLAEAAAEVAGWPLYITDKASLSSREIAAHSRLLVRRHNVQLVFVDYLQKIHEEKAKDERRAVNIASERLRVFAKDEQIAMVALAQLHRPQGGDPNAVPNMYEFKESGAAEADAHLALLLYRPFDKQTKQPTGKDELIIAAQRNGPTGSVEVSYDSANLTFGARRNTA